MVHEVVAGLVAGGGDKGRMTTPLAVLPLGSSNGLSKSLYQSVSPFEVARCEQPVRSMHHCSPSCVMTCRTGRRDVRTSCRQLLLECTAKRGDLVSFCKPGSSEKSFDLVGVSQVGGVLLSVAWAVQLGCRSTLQAGRDAVGPVRSQGRHRGRQPAERGAAALDEQDTRRPLCQGESERASEPVALL